MYLIFDTETTDKPPNDKKDVNPKLDYPRWPRLVQLGFALFDKERKLIKEYDEIVKPNGDYVISEGAYKTHGIDMETAYAKGIDIVQAVNDFYDAMDQAKYIVCHNMDFDYNIIATEHHRIKFRRMSKPKPLYETKEKICTMKLTTPYCKLTPKQHWKKDYKWPSLEELHLKLFGYSFKDAHNAIIDVRVTTQCFWELIDRGVIPLNDPDVYKKELNITEPDVIG